jgi:hypothetical protein
MAVDETIHTVNLLTAIVDFAFTRDGLPQSHPLADAALWFARPSETGTNLACA